uniref:NCK-associated protein 5-like n=1 Tax=Labrus bergylta TaxID=56723 RepID=A0A3Q3NGA5_9LABR
MSDETEQRMCEEDFGTDEEGEEADVESYLEDNSSELVDRLRELEAENSALMLANESQREAYERCLDEVANHVVQALLNQKDLREECIKLKMLVFDLERQNRALCELFQQKLPNHPTAHYQVNQSIFLCPGGTPPRLQCTAGNGYRTQHASPGPRGPAASMEALSPFFKKKAHILEVLRKMEETDPLKFHPSTTSLSFCDYSQVLMSTEAVLAAAEPLPLQTHHTHCHCSRTDTEAHQHVNGDGGAVKCEGGNTCCLHCKRSPESPPKTCNQVCSPPKANSAPQSRLAPAAATSECHIKSRTVEAAPSSKQCTKNQAHQQPAGGAAAAHPSVPSDQIPERMEEQEEPESFLNVSVELTGFTPVKDSEQISHCDAEASDGVQNGVASSLDDPSAIPEKDVPDHQEAPSVRAGASVSPSPSCLSDVKAAAINSPSKLLKFLKIPSIGEKSQAATSAAAVHLSPQLTRSSRIPCRTNNYEVYHSPVPTRRATTTERCRQPPPPPCRSESYPATHSAPTSPPQIPHYENVCNISREEEPAPSLEKRTTQEVDIAAQSSEVVQPQAPPPPPVRRSDSSSIPKRPTSGAGRSQADSSHHAFKDRLAALGKLRSSEDLQVGLRPVENVNEGSYAEERSKIAERPMEEQRHSKYADSLDSKPKVASVGLKYPQMYEQAVKSQPKQELCVTKIEASKSKIGLPSPNADAPQVLRNNIKCPGSLNLAYNLKAGPHSSNSPNKIPPKSPSKPCQPTLPPPPPRPPSEAEKPPPAPSPQSAIEQKVMKGIEENMLKLQEQDRGVQSGEVKQKASNGIASWFGLKKSKLPALSRKADAGKSKDEKKEWKINIPSVGRDSVKMATRCKEGVEGLNISTLMEKAEGLRRALEEERAYVERSGRGHSCEVVMDPSQGQLAVMYRGARSDNFMQQLLNRVVSEESQFTHCSVSRLLCCCLTQGSDRIGKITSDENLAESVHSQHFAGSGASTYTLDSGIGTFPLPDCSSGAAGRGLSKSRAGADHHSSGSPGRAGRRARTLERDLTSQEEYQSQMSNGFFFASFQGMKAGGPSSSRVVDPGSLPVPTQSGISRRGKIRTPSVPEMSREAGLELLRERPEEAISPSRPQVLETPESLSDSLYDSLSSCGSQG